MDGSQLLLKTDFADARKGYDKAQVDEFLRALSDKVGELKQLLEQATRRAEAAEVELAAEAGRRREAEDARAEAEAALRASEATRAELAVSLDEARERLDVDEVDVATGVLAMAKRTAEATVEEAVGRAQRIVEDAEVNAAVTQLEAEQRAERARRDMEEEIESLRRSQLDALEEEVRRRSAQRDALEADVVDLQDFIDGERRKVREAIGDLVRLLDADDGPLTIGRQPVLSVTEPLPDTETAPELPFREPVTDAERRATQIPHLLEGPDGEEELASEGDEGSEPGAEPVALDLEDDAEVTGDAVAGDGVTVIDLTDSSADDSTIGESAEESPLGSPHADADSAMRDFFERDEPFDGRRGLRRSR
jgi:cell division septum initiation protein DivIVA